MGVGWGKGMTGEVQERIPLAKKNDLKVSLIV